MLKISVIDAGVPQRPVRVGELAIKPKLLAEAEAIRQLERIAPDWSLHLYDGAIIDHILEVINNPRVSRTEIGRRYRARRSASGLAGASPFRGVPQQDRRRR